jgi:membrane fusion protein, multidrug efflux system
MSDSHRPTAIPRTVEVHSGLASRARLGLNALAILAAGLALAGCDQSKTQAEQPPQPIRAISVSVTEYQPVATIHGQIQARIQTDLAFRVGGKVIERTVDIGNHVRTGDVLVRLDNSEQKADVTIAEATLRATQADLNQKTLAFQRYQSLLVSNVIARQVFDQARQDMTTAQAALESAQASLATARDILSYTELKADADGVITGRNVEVGTVVSPAQTAVTIAHDGPRDAVFNVYEAFFLKGDPSTQVEVSAIDDPTRKATALIRETSPVIDPTTGTIQVKLTLPEDAPWPLGATVVGAFLAPKDKGVALPWSAMTSMNGGPAVWVVDPASHTASLRPIQIALHRSGDFVVSDGLAVGDLVVTEGGNVIHPNEILDWRG